MPREYYSVGEAAKTLGISVDTLRRWDRQGRIKAERDESNRRIVPPSEIERLRGDPGSAHLSARNRFNAIVTDVKVDGLMAQVEMVVSDRSGSSRSSRATRSRSSSSGRACPRPRS